MNNLLDEFRSTHITWDKATSRIYSPVTANESDENGRKLVVQIVNGGQVEDLTGASLHLYWETRDKEHDGLDVFKAVDLKKGEFELSYTTGMLSNKGVLNANLVLIDTVGRIVSERFKITVTEGIDNDAVQSENSFSSLTQALIDISNLEQNYAPRLNNLTAQLQQTAKVVNVKKYGAKGDGIVDDTLAIQSAINALTENSTLYFPSGRYKVSPQWDAGIDTCININKSNVTVKGEGASSEIFTTADSHIPILIKAIPNDDINVYGGDVENVVVKDLAVRGTGNYTYFAMSSGRGILIQNSKDVIVKDCFVYDMSMNGVTAEGSLQNIIVTGNVVDNCRYTAINFNGAVSQGIVSNNNCSNCTGHRNSGVIQVAGTVTVTGNTIYKCSGNGIVWGEGGFYGVGTIANNVIKQCDLAGIYVFYMGPATITGNVIINCTTGVEMLPDTTAQFTTGNEKNVVSNNLFLNCYNYGIMCRSKGTIISNNQIISRDIPSADQVSSNTSSPQYIFSPLDTGKRKTLQGIFVYCTNIDIVSNRIDGCNYGIAAVLKSTINNMANNSGSNTTNFQWLNSNGNTATGGALRNYLVVDQNKFRYYTAPSFGETTVQSILGVFTAGSIIHKPFALTQSMGWVCFSRENYTALGSIAGDGVITTIPVNEPIANIAAGDYVVICLSDGTLLKSKLASIHYGNKTITLENVIPNGKTISNGESIYIMGFAELPSTGVRA